ncbi:MAG: VOC family protein, partial [Alphaproteobacteria bacterium]|nr:VOC family protein [Alphaproteobacteria bacterium]
MTPAEIAAVAAAQVPGPGATVIDHLAHWVPDEGAASARLEALGFTLAPLSHQVTRAAPDAPPVSAGTANRTIMLREGYIEILTTTGDTPNARTLRQGMARYVGVHLIAFGLADPEATASRLAAAGFAPLPVVRLEREIETESGTAGHVRFRVLRVAPEAMPEGRIQFCKHLTPENMWQGRWLDHANGALGLASILVAVPDPAETAARFGRFLGRDARLRSDGAREWTFERGTLVVTDAAGGERLTGA